MFKLKLDKTDDYSRMMILGFLRLSIVVCIKRLLRVGCFKALFSLELEIIVAYNFL